VFGPMSAHPCIERPSLQRLSPPAGNRSPD